jgi:GTP cyclohydrolase I
MVKTTNPIEKVFNERAEENGNFHYGSGLETPLRDDAFDLSDDEKMDSIEESFYNILHTLGMDLTDDSLKDTPRRVAKMFVKEIFQGLNPVNMPEISVFDNGYEYSRMLVEKNITVKSTCEHHFLPIIGKAHVGYISNGKVIGLSKLNRIVDYFARRPQVQERMTKQILVALQGALDTQNVIVVVEAKHMCVSLRGIEDDSSTTVTLEYSGVFESQELRNEFLGYVRTSLVQ